MTLRFRPFPLTGETYTQISSRFRWRVPQHFNIGTACTDALPVDGLALIHVAGANARRYTFGELAPASAANRFRGR